MNDYYDLIQLYYHIFNAPITSYVLFCSTAHTTYVDLHQTINIKQIYNALNIMQATYTIKQTYLNSEWTILQLHQMKVFGVDTNADAEYELLSKTDRWSIAVDNLRQCSIEYQLSVM